MFRGNSTSQGGYTTPTSEQQLDGTDENHVFSAQANADVSPRHTIDGLCTPKTGVGRGAFIASILEQSLHNSPSVNPTCDNAISDSYTIFSDNRGRDTAGLQPANQWDLMANFAKQLGSEIGAKIAANISPTAHSGPNDDASRPQPSLQPPEWSKLNLVLKSDIREPPPFRGDGTDRVSVTEWQEMMQVYLNKKGYTVSEQGPEILDRLLGRARDVVKICIRNNPSINTSQDPDMIFTLLKQHYGEAISSTTPLKDFYETLPRFSESGLDYWIRLNKTVDLADECLRRQGKRVDDPSHEATMMFVRHCPDPGLYTALRCKPLEKWTAKEVQELIDSHQRDKCSTRTNRVQNTQKVEETPEAHCLSQQPAASTNQSNSTDHALLSKVIGLLEQIVVSQGQEHEGGQRRKERRTRPLLMGAGDAAGPCKVCKAHDHSTQAHCFKEGLCFKCFKTGHRGFECTDRRPMRQENPANDSQLN